MDDAGSGVKTVQWSTRRMLINEIHLSSYWARSVYKLNERASYATKGGLRTVMH